MANSDLFLEEIFDLEARYSPLLGCRSAVFLDPEERLNSTKTSKGEAAFSSIEFVGRDKELFALTKASENNLPIIALSGCAGVGKTTLIQKFVSQEKKSPHVFIQNLQDSRGAIIADLTCFLDSPSEARRARLKKALRFSPPKDWSGSKPLLLIFDDFDRSDAATEKELTFLAQNLKPLKAHLGIRVVAIVSSRGSQQDYEKSFSSHQCYHLPVQPLSRADQIKFIKRSSEKHGFIVDNSLFKVMVETSMGLPAVLETYLASAQQHWSQRDGTATNRIRIKDFLQSMQFGFRSLMAHSGTDCDEFRKLKPIQHEVIELLARYQANEPISLQKILENTRIRSKFSEHQLTSALRKLEDDVNIVLYDKSEKSIRITEPTIFPYIRLLKWRNAKCHSMGLQRLELPEFIDLSKEEEKQT